MMILFLLFAHILATFAKLLRPGGAKALVSENLLLKQQLLIIGRSRKRAPNLTPYDRIYLGLLATLLGPRRTKRSSIIIRPSTFHRFHEALIKRKYRLLYTSKRRGKPGPKGPSPELIQLILEMKHRNHTSDQCLTELPTRGRDIAVVQLTGWRSADSPPTVL